MINFDNDQKTTVFSRHISISISNLLGLNLRYLENWHTLILSIADELMLCKRSFAILDIFSYQHKMHVYINFIEFDCFRISMIQLSFTYHNVHEYKSMKVHLHLCQQHWFPVNVCTFIFLYSNMKIRKITWNYTNTQFILIYCKVVQQTVSESTVMWVSKWPIYIYASVGKCRGL